MKKIKAILINIGLLLLPIIAGAQRINVPNPGLPSPSGGSNATIFDVIMDFIQNIFLPMAGIVAVFFVIVGGFQYILSGANEDLAERGKKTLTNSIIGLIVIILSYAIVLVVSNTFRN